MASTYGRSRSRPLGVTVLCVLGFVGALRTLFGGLGLLGSASPLAVFGLVFLAVAIAKIAILYGLWTLERWGYTWAVRIYALSALFDLVTLSIFALAVDVVVVVYLTSKSDYFR